MTFFLQNGDMFAPTPSKESVLEELPVGNYIVVETMSGLMFKRVDRFAEPGRMYGDVNVRAKRILDTFLDRPRATGVLLSGEKGSGKSQLARNVSHMGYEIGLPTIIINAPYTGDAFNTLLASIEQPAIVLMDEFEKVYSEPQQQEGVLTLLDGVMTSKKLFIMTVNNKYQVNQHMKNRPGRIFYALEFTGLEQEFVREYCVDNLDDSDQIDNVLRVAAMFKAFNFDMLKALVEEMNRYKESAFESIEMLNAKPFDNDASVTYEVIAVSPGGLRSKVTTTTDIPLGGGPRDHVGMVFEFEGPVEGSTSVDELAKELGLDSDDVEERDFRRHFMLSGKNMRKVDVTAGHYEFQAEGFTFLFQKKVEAPYSLYNMG